MSKQVEKTAQEQTKADRAFALFQEIQKTKIKVGTEFLKLGAMFYEINHEQLYRFMDCDTFEEFIGMPELGFKRATVFLFIRVYDTFIKQLQMPTEAIAPLEISKLQIILPVIDAGADPVLWIEKTMHLSRHDLQNEVRIFQGRPELDVPIQLLAEGQKLNLSDPGANLGLFTEGQYQEYVKNQKCIICEQEEVDAHHFPKTKGAGAGDWKVIPLCRQCHGESHEDPKEFLWKWREKIFDYFYQFITIR